METDAAHGSPEAPDPTHSRATGRERVLDPRPGGFSDRTGARLAGGWPVGAIAASMVVPYVVLTLAMWSVGSFITGPVVGSAPGAWDADVERSLAEGRTPGMDAVTGFGSHLADTPTVMIGLVIAVSILLAFKHRQAAALVAASVGLEVASYLSTTVLVQRDRPPVPKLDTAPPTSSFPSGHVSASIAIYLSVAIATSSVVRNAAARGFVWTIAIVFPALVGFSRMYRGMHYPTDVFFGLLLGLASVACAVLVVRVIVASHDHHERVRCATADTDQTRPPSSAGREASADVDLREAVVARRGSALSNGRRP